MTAAPDTADIREVVLAHGRYVWRLLRYLGVPTRDLDDVCQDVFATVYQKLDQLSDDGIRPWLSTICINHAKNYRRRARVQREVLVDDVPDSFVVTTPDVSLDRARKHNELLALLDDLDEERRTVFVLHAIEDIPMEQVSKLVGCAVSTAYSRYERAYAELEKKLRKP
ncbi:RNA polymerase sigma factor RpoE [Labilithrix luteola]|uniref:RNA polymerase sigma factor RpoE n=1 Tax=Labilithrix luteola TaxID=1391654 RepID=A0A0K1QDV2_9BACT|nr:RNA polymerase sigma factor [Labilithrix luteola]AKV03939.1 RNA polymerase sigma factor RpoE [Labilithrix luteola]